MLFLFGPLWVLTMALFGLGIIALASLLGLLHMTIRPIAAKTLYLTLGAAIGGLIYTVLCMVINGGLFLAASFGSQMNLSEDSEKAGALLLMLIASVNSVATPLLGLAHGIIYFTVRLHKKSQADQARLHELV